MSIVQDYAGLWLLHDFLTLVGNFKLDIYASIHL